MIARDCGGPVCWCGSTARTYSTRQGELLNARPSEAALMIPLVETLRLAVPLRIADLASRRVNTYALLGQASRDVGTYGDVLLYGARTERGRKRVGQAFNALATGIAIACQHGPVHYGGVHWEAVNAVVPQQRPAPAARPTDTRTTTQED